MNILSRIFAYPILIERLAEKDAQITSLKIEVQELRDRLYLKHGLPPSGLQTATSAPILPYRTGRQRLRDMVTPSIGVLSAEEEKILEQSVTQ